jgi:adenosylcobinamide-phosphate synthase
VSFIALLIALALEQWRPLVDRRAVFAPVASYAGIIERHFDAGEAQQGVIAWLLAVVPVVAASWAVYWLADAIHPAAGLAVNVAILYVTMGFRQHSHYFTDIHTALKEGDLDTARNLLAQWRGHSCETLSASEVARLTIEGAFIVSERHVFGPTLWFVLLPGPTGAVLYRMALFLNHRWGRTGRAGREGRLLDAMFHDTGDGMSAADRLPDETEGGGFGAFAQRAFHVIDWLPQRVTASTFAIVGDFEDAVYCWRTQAARWPDPLLGVVLAAGAGALGVRLGMPIARGGIIEERPELGLGEDADTPFLDSTVGLVWRALSLWLVLLLVLAAARALG